MAHNKSSSHTEAAIIDVILLCDVEIFFKMVKILTFLGRWTILTKFQYQWISRILIKNRKANIYREVSTFDCDIEIEIEMTINCSFIAVNFEYLFFYDSLLIESSRKYLELIFLDINSMDPFNQRIPIC